MKTVKLIIEDKTIEVQISDEQIAKLTKPKKATGFERNEYEEYFTVNAEGETNHFLDVRGVDEQRYKAANYYTSEELAEWCCRSDNLNRQMRRWAAERNIEPVKWSDDNQLKYYLFYDNCTKKICVGNRSIYINNNDIYFNTKELAEQAIEEFGDEIKWLAENRPKWF